MSKTWETLFNLSSFMKYLLTKDLPDEKLEAPLYVLDSLYDLLSVTSAWIDKIKHAANDKVSLKNQLLESSAQAILSSRSNNNIEERKSNLNIRQDHTTGNLRSAYDNIPSAYYLKEEPNNNEEFNKCLGSVPKGISQVFLQLSKEMINGRHNGHYCRPCDRAVFSKKDWDNHMADRLHTFLIDDCEIKFGSCVYCKLIIFASHRDAIKLFKYHEMEHYPPNRNNYCTDETAANTETSTIPLKSKEKHFLKTDLNVGTSRSAETEVNYSTKRISSVFIELDKKMHSGKEKGFYCHICDKDFDVVDEWNSHFQEVALHNDESDSSACLETCDSCSLVIFAVPSIQKWYKSHHLCGHYNTLQIGKNSNLNSSVESLHSSAQSQENSQSSRNNAPFQNDHSSNTYKISQRFQDFNAKIHLHNVQGHFYCRPCNATLSPEDWNKHSVNKKHLELMASRKFRNWEGTCTYCSLTILGTRDTVKYYMQFHSVQHNKVVSYALREVDKSKMRKQRAKKPPSPSSISTLDDEEDKSYVEDKDIDDCKNEANFIPCDASGITCWYASTREEELQGSIRALIELKMKEKRNSGNPQYGAFCTICEYLGNNAFEWQDHITSSEHCQRKTSQDRQAYITDLNIYLFGNIMMLEKYKSLFKGDWYFFEN